MMLFSRKKYCEMSSMKRQESTMRKEYALLSSFIFALGLVASAHAVEFTEIPSSVSGLKHVGETWGASWGDFNGDRYPDLYSSNHRARPSIWRNNGDGTFTDIVLQFDTSYTWHDFPFTDTHGGAWGDFDNNGVQDLLVLTGVNFPAELFVNKGVGVAVDETTARGVPDDKEGRLATWYDFDSDGLLDIVINNRAPNMFLSQTAGNFSDATATVGLESFRTNFGVLSDIDMDDKVELFAIADGDFPEKVYKTDTVPFLDITATIPFSGLVVDTAIADFNNDLMPDILLVRGNLRPIQALKVVDGAVGEPDRIESWMAGGATSGEKGLLFQASGPITVSIYTQIGLPKFFIGAGGYQPVKKTFTLDPSLVSDQGIFPHDVASEQGFYIGFDTATQTWRIMLSPGTLSSRGYIVVEGTDMNDPTSTNLATGDFEMVPKLFINDGADFTDVSGVGLSMPVSCVATTVGDFDNDMDLDIYMVCRNGIENISNKLYLNQADGTFQEASGFGAEGVIGAGLQSGAGVGENVVAADYDLDGWLDLYVLNGLLMNPIRVGGPDQIFRNTTFKTSTNRWIELDLVGTVSNRDAVGAKVIVTSGGTTQLREQGSSYHRWSQNHSRIHVGLGQNDIADIKILWPNGEVDNFTAVDANNLYEISQGLSGNQTGTIAVVSAGSVPSFTAPQPGDECGVAPENQPENFPYHFDSAQDKGFFIWKDCASTGDWFVRATAANGTGVEYTGQLISNSTFSNVVGFGLEVDNDILDFSVSGQIDYFLKMSGMGVDGFDFSNVPGAGTCLNMTQLPEDAEVYLGRKHIPVNTPLNLDTIQACIEVSLADKTVSEAGGTVSLMVNLSQASSSSISVDYRFIADTATAGSDYAGTAGTLTFNPGETSLTIPVDILQDLLAEGSETFFVELSNTSGAFILNDQAKVTIEDDESSPCGEPTYDSATEQALFVWKDCSAGLWHVNGSGGGSAVGVVYNGSVESSASFNQVIGESLEASDTLDFTTDPNRINYELNIWNAGLDGFQFAPAGGAQTCLRPMSPPGVPVLVGQNKLPVVGAFNLDTLGVCRDLLIDDVSVSEGAGIATFTVSLSTASTSVVTLDYVTTAGTATGGVDYTEVTVPQTLTFNPGEISKTINIAILQDTLGEGNETFSVTLSNAVNALLVNTSGTATILDDEVSACGQPTYDSATEKALFVWKDCQTGDWYVHNTAGGDTAGTFFDGKVITTSGFDSVTGFNIELSDTLDNTTDPLVIDFLLKVWNAGEDGFQFKPVSEAGSCIDLGAPAGVPVLVGGDKTLVSTPFDISTLGACTMLPIDISIDDVQVSEVDAAANFTVTLSRLSSVAITVDYVTQSASATGNADYTEVALPTTLTFDPGVVSQQISVPILQDQLAEGTESFTVELSNANNASLLDSSGLGVILDDEISPCGQPAFNSSTDRNIYIWRDCGTDNWHLAASAGGAATQIIYQGDINSGLDITDVVLNSVEVNDVVDADPDPMILDFVLKMKGTGYDGFDFSLTSGAITCLSVSADSPGAGHVIVGSSQTTLTTPIDLATLGPCL
jgi:hypothetical protein